MTATSTSTGSGRAHGTRARYVVDKCRCEPCREANTAAGRERAQRVEPPYVDASPVRRHIRWLTRQGVGLKQIAKAPGISHGALSKVVYGTAQRSPSKRVRPATAEAVLAVTPAHGADGSKIPAGPTHTIVEQLLAKGWTRAAIAQAIGQNTPALQLGRRYVTRRHAKAIKALLDQPVPRVRQGLPGL